MECCGHYNEDHYYRAASMIGPEESGCSALVTDPETGEVSDCDCSARRLTKRELRSMREGG